MLISTLLWSLLLWLGSNPAQGGQWEPAVENDIIYRLESLGVQTREMMARRGPLANVAYLLNAWSQRMLHSGQFVNMVLQLRQQLPPLIQQDAQMLFQRRLQVRQAPRGFPDPDDALFLVSDVIWELQQRLELGNAQSLIQFFYGLNLIVVRSLDFAAGEPARILLADCVRFGREVAIELLNV